MLKIDLDSLIEKLKSIPGIEDKVDNSILAIREELVGIQALNPFSPHNSASRGLMQTGQFAQKAVLIDPEPTIIQEGISFQLADNTWKCRVTEDCVVRHIISSKDGHDIENAEIIILIVELVDGSLDIIHVPLYYSVSEFGFRYKRNIELLSNLTVGTKLNKNTILAETPGVVDGTYAYGVNADMKLVTDPNVGQDGIVVSEELMERMAYRTYHKFEANINQDKILLNAYGNENEYIGLPKVGDSIRPDGIVMALRTIHPEDIPPSTYTSMLIDPIYDECYFLSHANKVLNIKGKQIVNNKVVSVKVYNSPSKKITNLHCKDNIEEHAEDFKIINRRILSAYNKHPDKRKLTPRAHKTIVEAMALVSPEIKTELRYRNDVFTTRVEIVVETTHIPGIGSKMTCRHGGKGIVVNVLPKSELGADICMDPTSLPGRTNPGRVYEMYFNASSRNAKEIIVHDYHTNGLESAFKLFVDYMSYFDTELSASSKFVYENRHSSPEFFNIMKEHLDKIEEKENYNYYKVSSRKKAGYCVRDLENSMWAVKKRSVLINGKMTKKPVTVAPLYVLLLAKAHDSYLSCPSPYLNHYFIPVKPPSSMKHSKPWSCTPTKLSGETELRVMTTNTNNPKYVAEFISRNSNMESHMKICYTLLSHKTPTNIEYIDTKNPDGTIPDGNPLIIGKNIMKNIGIKFVTTNELEDDEDKKILENYVEGQHEFKK